MTDAPLGIVRDYAGLMTVLRARSDRLGVTRETLDAVTGLQSGYCSKLLAPVPIRNLGETSLGPILSALGLMIVVVEDPAMMAKYSSKLAKRRAKKPDAHAAMLTLKRRKPRGVWKGDKLWGRVMTSRRLLTMSPMRRKRIARQAARARWGKPKRKRGQAKTAMILISPPCADTSTVD